MGLPDGLTSENHTLAGPCSGPSARLWEGWEVTLDRQNCTAVSHAVFNSTTVQGHAERDPKKTVKTTGTGEEVHLSPTRGFPAMYWSTMLIVIQIFEEIYPGPGSPCSLVFPGVSIWRHR